MTIKLNYTHRPFMYSEIGQSNPLRWCIVEKDQDGALKNLTNWFKCRDFFNDVVVCHKDNINIYIYGMQVNPKHIDNTGFLHLVIHSAAPHLQHNIDNTINKLLGINLKLEPCLVDGSNEVGDNCYYLTIPPEMLNSALHISFITGMIRALNVQHKFSSYEELRDTENFYNELHCTMELWHLLKEDTVYKFLSYYLDKPSINYKHGEAKGVLNTIVHNTGIRNFYMNYCNTYIPPQTILTPPTKYYDHYESLVDEEDDSWEEDEENEEEAT